MAPAPGIRSGRRPEADVIDLRVPADPAYLAVIRTAATGVATRLDLTLDEIEDLRIAVDEACALLLDGCRATDSSLRAIFEVDVAPEAPRHPTIGPVEPVQRPARLDVRITGPRGRGAPDSGYSWTLLQALVAEVTTGTDATGRWIALSHTGRASTGPPGAAGAGSGGGERERGSR